MEGKNEIMTEETKTKALAKEPQVNAAIMDKRAARTIQKIDNAK